MQGASEVRRGQVVKIEGRNYLVVDAEISAKGNWRAYIQFKLKDLENGSTIQKRISSGAKLDTVFTDRRECEYLYQQGTLHIFMDNKTFEQFELAHEDIEGLLPYMLHNTTVVVTFLDGKPTSVDLPSTVELSVTEAEPSVRGDTATNVKKAVTCETGLVVQVPHFIKVGEKIKIDTRTGEFISRA